MNNLRHKKYKNKQLNNTKVLKVKNSTQKLENNFKPIQISIIDMDKIKMRNKENNILQKPFGAIGMIR